ncbi:MAG: MBL fold metallo-hydrolase [Deltaproteobacteria bacterium]|nr:MBL fold metallo-hydrolase [Deltaproteobacteria bacterium]
MSESSLPSVQSFAIGNIQLAKVLDSLEPTSPRFLYVDKRKDDFDPHLEWLQPHFVDPEKRMLLSIHTFLIQTKHHTILIDTCIGNEKQNLAFAQWNGRQGFYLRDLAAASCAPESVDYVFCTHMHLDHTGWSTRLQDGRWTPTFPNAKYLFNKREWEHWQNEPNPEDQAVVQQNIVPIIEAGQVEWVDNAWGIDDEVTLIPTPGHTPGHCRVLLRSNGQEAVITGDMMVHPVQIAEPQWQQQADVDKALAIETRTQFIDQHCDSDTLILGTHFNTATGVHIVSKGEQKRIKQ